MYLNEEESKLKFEDILPKVEISISIVKKKQTCNIVLIHYYHFELFIQWKDVPPERLLDIKLKCLFDNTNENDAQKLTKVANTTTTATPASAVNTTSSQVNTSTVQQQQQNVVNQSANETNNKNNLKAKAVNSSSYETARTSPADTSIYESNKENVSPVSSILHLLFLSPLIQIISFYLRIRKIELKIYKMKLKHFVWKIKNYKMKMQSLRYLLPLSLSVN